MKRYTETEKWSLPWFRKSSLEAKSLWFYINDRCDKAGVWLADWELASFQIGAQVREQHLAEMDGAILPIGAGRFLVVDFVPFQYKRLSEASPPHREVIELVARHRAAKDYTYEAPQDAPAAVVKESLTPAEPTALFPGADEPAPKTKKPPKDTSPVKFTFWCGAQVTEATVERLKKHNPGVPVEREIERAMDWAKGKKRQTKAVFAFLDNWMARKGPQQDGGNEPEPTPTLSTDQCLAVGMTREQIEEMIADGRCAPWPTASN